MLLITIPENEIYDEEKNEFLLIKKQTIKLEHSLLSISKWESKWHKPYLTTTKKTEEESVDYVRCMTITQNIDDMVYMGLTPSLMEIINEYIENPMTATTIRKKTGGAPSAGMKDNRRISQSAKLIRAHSATAGLYKPVAGQQKGCAARKAHRKPTTSDRCGRARNGQSHSASCPSANIPREKAR